MGGKLFFLGEYALGDGEVAVFSRVVNGDLLRSELRSAGLHELAAFIGGGHYVEFSFVSGDVAIGIISNLKDVTIVYRRNGEEMRYLVSRGADASLLLLSALATITLRLKDGHGLPDLDEIRFRRTDSFPGQH